MLVDRAASQLLKKKKGEEEWRGGRKGSYLFIFWGARSRSWKWLVVVATTNYPTLRAFKRERKGGRRGKHGEEGRASE